MILELILKYKRLNQWKPDNDGNGIGNVIVLIIVTTG